MKGRILLLAVLLCCCTGVMAQQKPDHVDIKVGPKVKLSKKELVDKILGNDEKGFYVISKYKTKLTISYFFNDLTLDRKKVNILKVNGSTVNYKGFIALGEEYYLFTTLKNKKEKTTTLYAQQLNKNTLELGEAKEVTSESYEGFKKRNTAGYSFATSPDSNYHMFIVDMPFAKESNEKFRLYVFDKQMNPVWSKTEVSLPDMDEDFGRRSTQIGNDGKVYMMANVITNREGKGRKAEITERVDMLVFSDDEEEPERFEIELDHDYFLSDVNFSINKTGDLQFVGYFSNDGRGQNGVFNLVVSLDDYSTQLESYTEFPTDFIVQHSSEKAKKKAQKKENKGKEVQFYSYEIDDLITNEDGSMTMVGEQYLMYVTTSTDANGNVKYTYHYVYGNIIMVQFDPLGDVAWMELIPKYQHTVNDGGYYSGYSMVNLSDGSLRFVFNDNPKNNYYESSGKFYVWTRKPKKTEVVMYEVELDGSMKRYTLVKAGTESIMSRPKVSFQTEDKELIILSLSKRLTRFAKLTF